jgi:hypothetical protein
MMKNISGIDSSAPSGHLFILIDFPGVKTPGFIILPFQGIYGVGLLRLLVLGAFRLCHNCHPEFILGSLELLSRCEH